MAYDTARVNTGWYAQRHPGRYQHPASKEVFVVMGDEQHAQAGFAKIFRHPTGKQILVMKDSGSLGEPVINVFVEPEEFGVCSVSMKYPDDDEDWDKRDEMFDATDETKAIEVANAIFRQSGQEIS